MLLQTESTLEIILGIMTLWRWKNDVMKTGGIVKQTLFVKNLHGENKLILKLNASIFLEKI